MRHAFPLPIVLTLTALTLTALTLACGSSGDTSNTKSPPDASGAGGAAGSAGTGGVGGAAGQQDAGPDGSLPDAGGTGGDEHDAGGGDAQGGAADADAGVDVPLDGMGEITGACGVLDEEEWNASAPFLFRNAIDFGTDGFVDSELSPGGAEVLAEGNLNPNSLRSEVVAFEELYRCELADLLKTEAEVVYSDPEGKKTDLLVEIDGRKVGVSVTRAYHYPPSDPYTVAEATTLLHKKLSDIPLSAANATPQDAWVRSILHVVAYDGGYADTIQAAWEGLDDSVRADTILVVTVTDGNDELIY